MIRNFTPHAVNFVDANGNTTIYPSEGNARVASSNEPVSNTPVPLVRTTFGEVEGLPELAENVWVIVSGLVLDVARRPDLIAPAEFVRNEAGQVVGCKAFRIF